MSQYYSRIHIKVKNPAIWDRFQGQDNEDLQIYEYASRNSVSYILDDEFFWKTESQLEDIIKDTANILGPDGIIIADTSNINVDPYYFCFAYFGGKVLEKYIDDGRMSDIEIKDIHLWLNKSRISVPKNDKENLFTYGIAYINRRYEAFPSIRDLPQKIYLRETGFNGRPDNIDKLNLDEEITFSYAPDKYDNMKLEIKSSLGSIGYLPSDVSNAITPLLINNKLNFKAVITEVIPLSKRNKHAKSPIVAIEIVSL